MDLLTLHIEHAVLLGLFTVLTVINCRLHDTARGAYWFPAYMMCAFVGSVLVALGGYAVSDAVAMLYGMAFFHIAYLCLHAGLEEFFDRRESPSWPILWQFTAVMLGIYGLAKYGVLEPDAQKRLLFYSAVFAFQSGLIAFVLFQKAHGRLRRPGRLMGTLLAMLAINDIIRAYLGVRDIVPPNFMKFGLGAHMDVLETTVLQGGITVAFVWMTAAVLHEKLDLLASTDPLTGLLNRRALEIAAEREIALSRRERKPLTAVLIDLDRFKQINDAFGHWFGDRALLEVSRCMRDQMRKSDLLARVGGDEFAVLLHNTSRLEAMEIAERLRGSLESLVVVEGECQTRICASFGLAEIDAETGTWPELVMKCDKAVYAVKGIGGNLAVSH